MSLLVFFLKMRSRFQCNFLGEFLELPPQDFNDIQREYIFHTLEPVDHYVVPFNRQLNSTSLKSAEI